MPTPVAPLTKVVTLTFVLAAAVAAGGACSAPGSSPPPNSNSNGSSSGGTASNDDAGLTPLALPFTLSDAFVPSGFMGDAPSDFNLIKLTSEASDCIARAPGALGNCYKIAWTPGFLPKQTTAWVGVYWQYPSNNWGGKPGRPIAPGATKVTFLAAGAAGGEQIDFIVGGVNKPSSGTPGIIYSDDFKTDNLVTLTTSWAKYEVPLSGDSYSSVIGGFAWTITTSSTSPVTFYVDNIQWENTPADDAGTSTPPTDAGTTTPTTDSGTKPAADAGAGVIDAGSAPAGDSGN